MTCVIERRRWIAERWRHIPGRCIGILAAAKGIEQFLTIGTARALLSRSASGGDQIHLGKGTSEVADKLGQIEIGQPRIDNDRLGRRRFGFGPCLRTALGLAHLPAQAGKYLSEPLAKAAIGAGHQSGAWPDADIGGWDGN